MMSASGNLGGLLLILIAVIALISINKLEGKILGRPSQSHLYPMDKEFDPRYRKDKTGGYDYPDFDME
jgi:hypothetical protein